jgi:hypothetical protein
LIIPAAAGAQILAVDAVTAYRFPLTPKHY